MCSDDYIHVPSHSTLTQHTALLLCSAPLCGQAHTHLPALQACRRPRQQQAPQARGFACPPAAWQPSRHLQHTRRQALQDCCGGLLPRLLPLQVSAEQLLMLQQQLVWEASWCPLPPSPSARQGRAAGCVREVLLLMRTGCLVQARVQQVRANREGRVTKPMRQLCGQRTLFP